MPRIPESEWQWYGNAGHLCVGHRCEFRLTTEVGPYLISTVGEWRLKHTDPEWTVIGAGRLYETMAFRWAERCECGCGKPVTGDQKDFGAYNDRKAAREGHMALCRKWAGIAGRRRK